MYDKPPDGAGRPGSLGARWLIGPAGSGADPGYDVKPGARIDGLSPQMRSALPRVTDAFRDNEAPRPVITSGNDSRHKTGSRHYAGEAIDIRCNHLPDEHCERITDALRKGLGPDFDVIFERFPKNPGNDHIHLEHDPKPQRRSVLDDGLTVRDWMTVRNRQAGQG